jgi:predicted RNA-binding protein associated with RNAse of E/G family
MKRKRADRLGWWRITQHRFALTRLENSTFRGYVSLYCIDGVREPLIINHPDGPVCLADSGYSWLQHFPDGERYALTSIFNAKGELIRWYLDICKRHWYDEQGILWYDDLYLDLDIAPDGSMHVLDVDELDKALQQGEVTTIEYELAWRELDTVMSSIEENMFPLFWFSEEHRQLLLKLV